MEVECGTGQIVNDTNYTQYSNMIQVIYTSYKRVFDNLGIGHSEAIYHKALLHELNIYNLSIDSERNLNVIYKDSKGINHIVGSERIDLFIHNNNSNKLNEGNIILELKAIPKSISNKEIFQIKKYFRELTKEGVCYNYGIIINFNKTNNGKENFIIIK